MRLSERDIQAYTFRAAAAVGIALILILSYGCGKKAPEAPTSLPVADGSAQIFEIPVEQVKDKEIPTTPGKDKDDTLVVVTVPASSVPTVVRVHHRPKPITKQAREIITGDKGSPDISVTADNKGVTAETERTIGLWPYIAGLFTLVAGYIAARRWLRRFAWFTKALSVVRRIIGL